MFSNLGSLAGKVSDRQSYTRISVASSVVFFGAVEFAAHELVAQLDIHPLADAMIDAALVGSAFGFAFWIVLAGMRERRLRVRQDLERIAELNHEVRNALEVIVHSQHSAESKCREMVMESANRIDGVLKRLFPVVGG